MLNPEVFPPEELDIINQAFQQTWAMVEEDRSRDPLKDEERKLFIRKKLLTIASAGVVDIELMRKMALAAMRTWPDLLMDTAERNSHTGVMGVGGAPLHPTP